MCYFYLCDFLNILNVIKKALSNLLWLSICIVISYNIFVHHSSFYIPAERPALKIEPPDKEKLAEAREKRMKEIAMFEIVREIAFYFVFVALIVLVASHNRDKKAYSVKEAIVNVIDIKKMNSVSLHIYLFLINYGKGKIICKLIILKWKIK